MIDAIYPLSRFESFTSILNSTDTNASKSTVDGMYPLSTITSITTASGLTNDKEKRPETLSRWISGRGRSSSREWLSGSIETTKSLPISLKNAVVAGYVKAKSGTESKDDGYGAGIEVRKSVDVQYSEVGEH